MKILLNKSNENLEASIFLKDEEFYSSSIHCAYYSCIQLMRYIIFNIHNIDEEEFDNNQNITNIGSHNYLLNEIISHLQYDKIDIRSLKNTFRNIKELRKNADYKQIKILLVDCNNAYDKANNLNKSLKSFYTL